MVGRTRKNSELLSEFAWEIINKPESMFFLDKDDSDGIDWNGSERDIVIFTQVLKILEHTQDLDDEQFLKECLGEIESLLNHSVLFNGLDSPSIVVSEAHNGTTPKEHSINVLKKLRTMGVSSETRVMLRFSALFHDVGKASCVGLSEEEIQLILANPASEIHSSYPNHSEISTLVIQKIRKELLERFPFSKKVLSEDLWSSLEFVVLYHHLIPNIYLYKIRTLQESAEQISNLEKSQQLAVLLGLYLLNMADVDSNDYYRSCLADNSSSFGKILGAINIDLSAEELGILFYIYFEGTSFALANNLQLESGSPDK